MRIQNYLTGIEGVSAASIANINAPINRRYHTLQFFYTESGVAADVTAGIEYVRLYVNGVLLRDLTPAQILGIAKLNQSFRYSGVFTPTTGNFMMYFSEPWRASVLGEEAVSWPLYADRGVATFTIEVKIASGRTSPGLQVLASYDYARNVSDNAEFVSIIKQLRQNFNVSGGTFDITTLNTNFPIQRIHLIGGSGINWVEVYRDSDKVHEATFAQNGRLLADHGLNQTDSGFSFPIVFDLDQQISSPLIVNRDLDVRINTGGSGSLTAIVESRVQGYI